MATPEGALKAEVIAYLNGILCAPEFFWRLNSGKIKVKRGFIQLLPEGTPDLCVFLKHGRLVFLELKAPKAKTHKDRAEKQAEFAAVAESLGHQCYRCETLADVQLALGLPINQE